jgi:hypothetical protein
MARELWTVRDGPLKGDVFPLEESKSGLELSFTLADGQVAVYRTGDPYYHLLVFVGMDPFA